MKWSFILFLFAQSTIIAGDARGRKYPQLNPSQNTKGQEQAKVMSEGVSESYFQGSDTHLVLHDDAPDADSDSGQLGQIFNKYLPMKGTAPQIKSYSNEQEWLDTVEALTDWTLEDFMGHLAKNKDAIVS